MFCFLVGTYTCWLLLKYYQARSGPAHTACAVDSAQPAVGPGESGS